jgi:hypothetical protein
MFHRKTQVAIGLAMRAAAHFLAHQGISLRQHQVREQYFRIMSEQQHASPEEHPNSTPQARFVYHSRITCESTPSGPEEPTRHLRQSHIPGVELRGSNP